jgi:hypothetical protein
VLSDDLRTFRTILWPPKTTERSAAPLTGSLKYRKIARADAKGAGDYLCE